MSAQLDSPVVRESDFESSYGAYVHKLRLHGGDGGLLIELVDQRIAQRQAESRAARTLATIGLLTLLALVALSLFR
jgi:hypothetical protein